MVSVEVQPNYSLELTLMPSFTLSLFRKRRNGYVKIAGRSRGAFLWQEGNEVLCRGCSYKELIYWTGVWFRDYKAVDDLSERLIEMYSGVGLSINPYDYDLMFIPIYLSRNTDYHTNVLRWSRKIFSKARSWGEILRMDLSAMGRSFQLRQLKNAMLEYDKSVRPYIDSGADILRRKLLSIKYVGPKTADAYLLFTGKDLSAIPIDRHFRRMLEKLGLYLSFTTPEKKYCLKYRCIQCPRERICIRRIFSSVYRRMSGWIQTVFYIHDKLFCWRKKCSECRLRGMCTSKSP